MISSTFSRRLAKKKDTVPLLLKDSLREWEVLPDVGLEFKLISMNSAFMMNI